VGREGHHTYTYIVPAYGAFEVIPKAGWDRKGEATHPQPCVNPYGAAPTNREAPKLYVPDHWPEFPEGKNRVGVQ
jgi:hypothetical protein